MSTPKPRHFGTGGLERDYAGFSPVENTPLLRRSFVGSLSRLGSLFRIDQQSLGLNHCGSGHWRIAIHMHFLPCHTSNPARRDSTTNIRERRVSVVAEERRRATVCVDRPRHHGRQIFHFPLTVLWNRPNPPPDLFIAPRVLSSTDMRITARQ